MSTTIWTSRLAPAGSPTPAPSGRKTLNEDPPVSRSSTLAHPPWTSANRSTTGLMDTSEDGSVSSTDTIAPPSECSRRTTMGFFAGVRSPDARNSPA